MWRQIAALGNSTDLYRLVNRQTLLSAPHGGRNSSLTGLSRHIHTHSKHLWHKTQKHTSRDSSRLHCLLHIVMFLWASGTLLCLPDGRNMKELWSGWIQWLICRPLKVLSFLSRWRRCCALVCLLDRRVSTSDPRYLKLSAWFISWFWMLRGWNMGGGVFNSGPMAQLRNFGDEKKSLKTT